MSDILNKFRNMNCDLQIAAREMSKHEYSLLFYELADIRSRALELRAIEHKERLSKLSYDERITRAKHQLSLHRHVDSIVATTGLTHKEIEALRDADK